MKNTPKTQKPTAFSRKLILTLFVLSLLFVRPVAVKAQGTIPDSDGKPLTIASPAADADGSVFYKLDWSDGSIGRKGGQQYTGLKLKYDEYDDLVVYEGSKSDPMVPVYTDINTFTLKNVDGKAVMNFANGFPAVDKQTTASYYEVIAGGKTQLLKHYSKTVSERSNGDNTTAKMFNDSQTYYIYKNGTMTVIKPDAKSIVAALADKEAQVTAYIKSNHLGYKDDDDLGKIFTYYNSLQ